MEFPQESHAPRKERPVPRFPVSGDSTEGSGAQTLAIGGASLPGTAKLCKPLPSAKIQTFC